MKLSYIFMKFFTNLWIFPTLFSWNLQHFPCIFIISHISIRFPWKKTSMTHLTHTILTLTKKNMSWHVFIYFYAWLKYLCSFTCTKNRPTKNCIPLFLKKRFSLGSYNTTFEQIRVLNFIILTTKIKNSGNFRFYQVFIKNYKIPFYPIKNRIVHEIFARIEQTDNNFLGSFYIWLSTHKHARFL